MKVSSYFWRERGQLGLGPGDWQSSIPVLDGSSEGIYIIHQTIHLFCVFFFCICVLFYSKFKKIIKDNSCSVCLVTDPGVSKLGSSR